MPPEDRLQDEAFEKDEMMAFLFNCEQCESDFTTKLALQDHIELMHPLKKIKCPEPKEAKRTLVKFNYNALDPEFLFMMAEIAYIADKKYGDWEQYKDVRLKGNQSPISHIYHHLGNYRSGADYENLNGEFKRKKVFHLAAVAYNAMMEAWYCMNVDEKKL